MMPASFNRIFQIVATTTSDVITGRKKAARKKPRNRTVRFNNSADARPSTGPIAMPMITNSTVLKKDFTNFGSWTRSA